MIYRNNIVLTGVIHGLVLCILWFSRHGEAKAVSCDEIGGNFELNFLSVGVSAGYENWLLPYAFFALASNRNSSAEIVVQNASSFRRKFSLLLDTACLAFPNRILVRNLSSATLNKAEGLHASNDVFRFLEVPVVSSIYTYIGDVDILTLDENIVEQHVQHMGKIGLPYSNAVRDYNVDLRFRRLTGLHFVRNSDYYSERLFKSIESFVRQTNNDEVILQNICRVAFGLPPQTSEKFRPVHGIHLSNSRGKGGMALSAHCNECKRYKQVANASWMRLAMHVSRTMQLVNDKTVALCSCCKSSNFSCRMNNVKKTSMWLKQFVSTLNRL